MAGHKFWRSYLWMYLVEKPGPFNSEKLKSYKSLEVYEYFVPHKVGCVFSREVQKEAGIFVLRAEVIPGQAESQVSYLPWLITNRNGEINNCAL